MTQYEHIDGHENKDESNEQRKTYYISVQAGQILEDQEAAVYELVINANDEEVSQLREMFSELSSMGEAEAAYFGLVPLATNSDEVLNEGSVEILGRIYRLLHECGTDETKQIIDGMGFF